MIPIAGTFNIVLLGAWNPSIFSENWITENLADSQDSSVTVAYPIDDPNAPRKIDFEGISLFAGRSQLLLAPISLNEVGIQKCASILIKILGLLSHTPVRNCGINFSFEESHQFGAVIQHLTIEDNIPANHTLQSTKLERNFKLEDGNTLNLTINDTDNGIGIRFNYHYDQNEIQAYTDMFNNNLARQKLTEAINFCQVVYGLTLEDTN